MKSLKYFKPSLYSLTTPHYIWSTAANNPYECSKSTVLARMVSGRFRTEAMCRHWSTNKNGYCRAPTCHQVYGTLEHLLVGCPALDGVRERLYLMWLERSVMYPPLHSTIRDILASSEHEKVQFILEPLAFTSLASSFKRHGTRFIQQLAYLTRTFAFYMDKEYKKITKNFELHPQTSLNNHLTNTDNISVAATDDHPAMPTSGSTVKPLQSHQPQLDRLGLTDVHQEEYHPPTKAGLFSLSSLPSPAVTSAILTPGDDVNVPVLPALCLADVPSVPSLDLADVAGVPAPCLADLSALGQFVSGVPDQGLANLSVVPAQGLSDVRRASHPLLTVIPTEPDRNCSLCIATPTSTERDCSNLVSSPRMFSSKQNQAWGGCAGGAAGQLINNKAMSGAAWDIFTHPDYEVRHPSDQHLDSAGGTDRI